ncbi:predicted protein [Botrytis cinerea T4]|uniref:Uncharacterized protein n=1 Tax=Botryotinia fuckeliana (strain T4) TaxID=999810 RepID=G2Y5J8_BOTF4|nr:predicted protein [Botrytis cinerea T4]
MSPGDAGQQPYTVDVPTDVPTSVWSTAPESASSHGFLGWMRQNI